MLLPRRVCICCYSRLAGRSRGGEAARTRPAEWRAHRWEIAATVAAVLRHDLCSPYVRACALACWRAGVCACVRSTRALRWNVLSAPERSCSQDVFQRNRIHRIFVHYYYDDYCCERARCGVTVWRCGDVCSFFFSPCWRCACVRGS